MTQIPDDLLHAVTPAQAVARRLREVRDSRGWSAQELAQRCDALGMPGLDRSTITNIETGRRKRIGVDELLILALALGVAPIHLLVPITEEWYAVAPHHASGTSRVRQWVRGNYPMTGVPLLGDRESRLADRETYRQQQPSPEDEWEPPVEPTPQEIEARQQERIRRLLEAEEAGLVRITRRESGAWEVFALDQTDTEEETRGEHQ